MRVSLSVGRAAWLALILVINMTGGGVSYADIRQQQAERLKQMGVVPDQREKEMGCYAHFVTGRHTGGAVFTVRIDARPKLAGKHFLFEPFAKNVDSDIVFTLDGDALLERKGSSRRQYKATSRDEVVCFEGSSQGESRCYTVADGTGTEDGKLVLVARKRLGGCHFFAYGTLQEIPESLANRIVAEAATGAANQEQARRQSTATGRPLDRIETSAYELSYIFEAVYHERLQDLDVDGIPINLLFTAYVEQFSEICSAAVPSNYRVFEHRKRVWVGSDWGYPVQTHYYQWVLDKVIKVKPSMYSKYESAWTTEMPRAITAWHEAGADIRLVDAFAMIDRTGYSARSDAGKFLEAEGCGSPTTERFERNFLRAFAESNQEGKKDGKPTVSVDRVSTKHEYGKVPDGFVPTIPDPLPSKLPLYVTTEKSSRGTHLVWITVGRVSLSALRTSYSALPGDVQAVLLPDIDAATSEGALILECTYAQPNGLRLKKVYWYKQRTPTVEPARLRARTPKHPLLEIGAPKGACPANAPQA